MCCHSEYFNHDLYQNSSYELHENARQNCPFLLVLKATEEAQQEMITIYSDIGKKVSFFHRSVILKV
jgi:hypothetical protein